MFKKLKIFLTRSLFLWHARNHLRPSQVALFEFAIIRKNSGEITAIVQTSGLKQNYYSEMDTKAVQLFLNNYQLQTVKAKRIVNPFELSSARNLK